MKPFFRYVLRQTVLVNLLFVLAMAVGLFSLFDLPVERYPDVQMGKVQINTVLPGASPEEIESLITDEIEEALDDLESVEFIRSTSYRERSVIMVKFIDDTDYDRLYEELRLKVLSIMNELPDGIDPPRFTEIRVSEWLPVASVNLIGDRSNRALSLMAEEMKLHLRQIPGVKEVQLNGEYIREFHVYLNPRLLDKYGVTFDEVARALSEANISLPAHSCGRTLQNPPTNRGNYYPTRQRRLFLKGWQRIVIRSHVVPRPVCHHLGERQRLRHFEDY
jgi:HAE1 family hydrophobic/amphiphilic exporter-1